jgi:NADH dehydrogenase
VLSAFEAAEMETDAARRDALLRFVIVGAGPTGVELAGTIAELARFTLAADFRRIDPRSANIVLVEAGPRVLAAFKEPQSTYALRALQKLGVEVRVGSAVTGCDAGGVWLGAERLASATVIWAAGVAASPVAGWLGVPTDRAGRALVQVDLSAGANTFVIGDSPPPPPFAYRDPGNLATIGRKRAVIEFPHVTLRGFLAWWIWGIAHIFFLVGVPSPVLISFRWVWEYLTYGRGARLITGHEHAD